MLVVVIVIAILGTNLLLGFFVANSMGYGPQTLSELMTGIYKAPVGWTVKKLAKGELKSDHRRHWAQQLGTYCLAAPNDASASLEDDEVETEDDLGEESDAESYDDSDDSVDEDPVEEESVSGIAADLALLRQVTQFVQISPVLLDELRFQWKYLPQQEPGPAENIELDSDNPSESAESDTGPVTEEMESESFGESDSDDDASDSSQSHGPLWTKDRLVEALHRWNEYLETYEPTEVVWWLDWFKRWEAFAAAWQKHCTEVLAVGLVERLLHENAPEPEVTELPSPKSVKSVKEAPKEPVKKPAQVNPKQQWIRSQHSRLLQSLFSSAAKLQQAQHELLQFTSQKALKQWNDAIRSESAPTSSVKDLFCLPPLVETNFGEDFKPTYALLIVPDYRQLLNLDNGKLVSAAVDSSIFRSLHHWIQDDSLSGQWHCTNENFAVGFLDVDEATVRQKASWINENFASAMFLCNDYSLVQTCNIVVCEVASEGSPLERVAELLEILSRRPIQRRMTVGNTVWQLFGKKLRAIPKDETEVEPLEISLGFDGVAAASDLPDLSELSNDTESDIDDDEDW